MAPDGLKAPPTVESKQGNRTGGKTGSLVLKQYRSLISPPVSEETKHRCATETTRSADRRRPWQHSELYTKDNKKMDVVRGFHLFHLSPQGSKAPPTMQALQVRH